MEASLLRGDPNVDNINLHFHFHFPKQHAQIPSLLNRFSADACTVPGAQDYFTHIILVQIISLVLRSRLTGQKRSVIESPHPGRGSTHLLTKIWDSGANIYRGAATPQAAATLPLINPSTEPAFLTKPTHACREAQDSGALGYLYRVPRIPCFVPQKALNKVTEFGKLLKALGLKEVLRPKGHKQSHITSGGGALGWLLGTEA